MTARTKWRRVLAFAIASCLGLSTSAIAQNYNPNNYDAVKTMNEVLHPNSDLVLVASHRGLHALVNGNDAGVPENSLQAIGLSAQAGNEEIELDIKLTSDGIPVMSHDLTWGRETCYRSPLYSSSFDPFTPPGNSQNDSENPAVNSVTLSWMRSWIYQTYLRDSINLSTNCQNSGLPRFSGEYPSSLQEVLDYLTQNRIAMVVALDIRDAATASAAWKVIASSSDYAGRSYAQSTLFKVPAKAFATPQAVESTFSFGPGSKAAYFQPVYNTSDIEPATAQTPAALLDFGGTDVDPSTAGYGSEEAISQSLASFENDLNLNVAAVEVQIKKINGILSTVLPHAKVNQRTGSPESVTVFSPYVDYWDPSDPNHTTPLFFKTTSYCCQQLSDFYYNGAPYGQPSDTEDDRPNLSYLLQQGFNSITYDNPSVYTSQLATQGKRNLSRIEGSTAVAYSLQPLRILPLGDSITQGYQSSTGNGYRQPLQADIQGAGEQSQFVGTQSSGSMSNPQNEGHDGWTITQIAGVATSVVEEFRPNVVTLLIGTNDINLNDDVSDAPTRMHNLIDQIFAAGPDATIVVAALPPTSDQNLQAGFESYNEAVLLDIATRRQAGQHILWVDTSDIDESADKADTLHPNDAGYQILGNDFNRGVQIAIDYGWVHAPVSCSSTPGGCTAGSGPHTPGPIGAAPQPGTSSPMEVASGVGADPSKTRTVFADINGDGKADYVVIDNTTGSLTVWLNGGPNTAAQNGWVWVPQGTIASGVAPGAQIQLADLDGDGRADYIIVDPTSGALSVYLNGGQNSAAPNGWVWYPKGQIASGVSSGSSVRFGDINDDGLADYLIVDTKTGAVQAYLNGGQNSAAHDGWVWLPQGTIATGVGAPAGSLIQFADINNDGYADYLVTDINNGTVHAWLNQGPKSGGGWGFWGQGQIAPGSGAPSRFNVVQMVDLDGDGRADYLSLAQNSGAVRVWLNKGKDTTAVANWLPLGEIASGGNTPVGSIIMKDLDGDGLPDYLQVDDSTGEVTAYLNGGPKPGGGWIWYPKNQVFSIGNSAGGNPPSSGVLYRMGDINGDGKVDYVAIISATGEIYAALNEGKPTSGSYWNWGPLNDIANVGIKLPGTGISGQINPSFAPITRHFGDDLILNTNDGNLKIISNIGASEGYFAPGASPLAYATGTGTLINLNDIDGDGAPDYLVTTSTGAVDAWKNNVCQNVDTSSETCSPNWTGLGQITTGVAAPSSTTRIVFADIDGNGRADYLVLDLTTGAITSAWLNNNGGAMGNWDPN